MSDEKKDMFGTEAVAEAEKPLAFDPTSASAEIGKISDLKRADYNPRQISEWAKEALRKSMMKFGDLSGIVVNIRTGRIVGGHQRVSLFDQAWRITKQTVIKDDVGTVAEGLIATPYGNWSYREVDWDETLEMAANIAANKHGGLWDINKLRNLTGKIKDADSQLVMFTGLEDTMLENMGIQKAPEKKVEDADYKMKRFLENDIKQIVLYFATEEYNSVLQRLSAIMEEKKLEENTSTFLFLLDHYEKNRTKSA
jgi:hypothetical protein